MVGRHDVFLEGKTVGVCLVEKQGLYYRLCCRCRLDTKEMYSLCFDGNRQLINLGIVIPNTESYGLVTRISIKSLSAGDGMFILKRKEIHDSVYYLDDMETRYQILRRLPQLRLRKLNNRAGVIILKAQGSQDSDLNL